MGGDEHQEPGPPATPSAHAVPSWPGLCARARPPKHTGPFTAWEAWPSGLRPASVSSTALDSAGPPRPRGSRPQGPSALALDVRAPPTTTAQPTSGPCTASPGQQHTPSPRPGGLCCSGLDSAGTGTGGSLGLDKGPPRLIFTVRV